MPTPRPWLPNCGLTTTGKPISSAAAQASSGPLTAHPMGTGTPATRSRLRVSSLSWATSSAIAPVWSVSAVRIRRCLTPQPSRTRLPSLSRRNGMPRARAARTMDPVLGPKRTSLATSRSASRRGFSPGSIGSPRASRKSNSRAVSRQARPSFSSSHSTTTRQIPGSPGLTAVKETGLPACLWSARVRRARA